MEVLAIANNSVTKIQLQGGLMALGGMHCSGKKIIGLKHQDDYVVFGRSGESIVAHILKGKKTGPKNLIVNQLMIIDDLTLCLMDSSAAKEDKVPDDLLENGTTTLLNNFSQRGSYQKSLEDFLACLVKAADMQKGVLLTKNVDGTYRLISQKNMRDGENWLTEALVKDVLASGKSVWLQNRIGSAFENSKSLIAAGFLSTYAIPLMVRGDVIGAVVIGSQLPHSGISAQLRDRLEAFVKLGSVLFWFYRRDKVQQEEIERLKFITNSSSACPLITSSSKLQQEIEIAQKIAFTKLGVLIQGETGVGKELMAQWIHAQSERRNAPFVAINCGAIPSELLESILFGHKRGAFTGAVSDQIGKFQLAHGGTLFLDEIGDLPERMQAKLLRVLQEGVVESVGSSKPQRIDVRIISATHHNLSELIKMKAFREDLYYRLAETTVSISPLRERPEDIALLAAHFLKLSSKKSLSAAAYHWLSERPWKGNVRELKSAVNRAAALAIHEEITEKDFLLGLPKQHEDTAKKEHWLGADTLDQAKGRFILEKVHLALKRVDGNKQRAAELLGVTPRTLFRYLEDNAEVRQSHPEL